MLASSQTRFPPAAPPPGSQQQDPSQQNVHQQIINQQQQSQQISSQNQQGNMRLRDEPPTITNPAPRTSRKRKSPPAVNPTDQPPQQQSHSSQIPPPHPLAPPPPHMQLPQGYQYAPPGYVAPAPPTPGDHEQSQSPPANSAAGRALSNSKRAEQNRKAQRAFRERRDQHVKALESRSQLLDAALASADEANRRWEECRALVDQLRIENAALRAELNQAQGMLGNNRHGAQIGETRGSLVGSKSNDSVEASSKDGKGDR